MTIFQGDAIATIGSFIIRSATPCEITYTTSIFTNKNGAIGVSRVHRRNNGSIWGLDRAILCRRGVVGIDKGNITFNHHLFASRGGATRAGGFFHTFLHLFARGHRFFALFYIFYRFRNIRMNLYITHNHFT